MFSVNFLTIWAWHFGLILPEAHQVTPLHRERIIDEELYTK